MNYSLKKNFRSFCSCLNHYLRIARRTKTSSEYIFYLRPLRLLPPRLLPTHLLSHIPILPRELPILLPLQSLIIHSPFKPPGFPMNTLSISLSFCPSRPLLLFKSILFLRCEIILSFFHCPLIGA